MSEELNGGEQIDHTAASLGSVASKQDSVRVPFVFHGQGGEFFRIWIVNIGLTLLTLGIYSAWAKVRTKRYFYGNTELDGDRFDYLGDPIAILKGRILAVALLVAYQVLVSFAPPVITGAVLLLFLSALPWIIYRALRFNAQMSSWRGVRFGFDGDWVGAAKAYVLWPLFGLITLGFGMPYAWYKQNQYLLSNYRFGSSNSISTTVGADFYGIALRTFLFAFISGIVVIGVTALLGATSFLAVDDTGGSLNPFPGVVLGVLYFLFYLMIFVVFQALYLQTVYNNIDVDDNRFGTSVSVRGLSVVLVSNTTLTLLTLGLYYPWAQVRMAQYVQDNLWIDAVDLDSFVAKSGDGDDPLGEEIGEAFDLGIGI